MRCGAASKSDPTYDEQTVMNGAPKMVLWVGRPPSGHLLGIWGIDSLRTIDR